MSEVIRTLKFEHFRGLPKNEFNLKGKSLVLLGTNGKGKSSIVDGLEFLFSGQIGRFVGTGTRNIDHDDAVRHIKRQGVTKVTAALTNGKISRILNAETTTVSDEKSTKSYLQKHQGVDAFILRRSKILEFVCDQDADRYRKFIKLLGISHVDNLQRCFVDAEREMVDRAQRARIAHTTTLAVFNDSAKGFEPKSLGLVLNHISDSLHSFGLEKLEQWSNAPIRLPLLKGMRPEANKDKINLLTKAIVSLETPMPSSIEDDMITANALRLKIVKLEASSVDGPRSSIITEGSSYLSGHEVEDHCPLCEEPFSKPLSELLDRLNQRSDALRGLREGVANRRSAVSRIQTYAIGFAARLKKDLEYSSLIGKEARNVLRNTLASALRWQRSIKRIESNSANVDLATPVSFSSIGSTRSACAKTLTEQKAKLTPGDSSKLESAIALLERGIISHEEISTIEKEVDTAEELARRSTVAKDSFSSAREFAIQKVFDQIAATVLDYYCRLHSFDAPNEESECTVLELTSTSRSATGGLRLAIQFLRLANQKDPRAFLSEGHLDSLGLCLFLASVRIFNPSGSLLILDDVLTSIDKEHRHRVSELLFREFSDFQIILTTHDEHWHAQLNSSAIAWGIQKQWSFQQLDHWTVDAGPSVNKTSASWEFIELHLNEASYRELGGAFRAVFEDFLKRTAAKMQLEVKFKFDGKYTSGDFIIARTHSKVRDKLIQLNRENEVAIREIFGRVFGQGELINYLSHDSSDRFEVTYPQANDFVQGLRDLTKMCGENSLIRGN
jgi:recombinational DNA repair ATPase RecF